MERLYQSIFTPGGITLWWAVGRTDLYRPDRLALNSTYFGQKQQNSQGTI